MEHQPSQTLNCTQCGGELHPDEGQIFLTCPFCSSTVYIDKTRVVFHWYLAPTLDQEQALGALRRWMSGNQTVKDLDQKSQVTEVTFEYFPLWVFKLRASDGRETIELAPAAATAISEIANINLPAGDLRKVDPAIEAQSVAPSVPLQAALGWIQGTENTGALTETATAAQGKPAVFAPLPAPSTVAEQSLVHVPLFTVKYSYLGKSYTALVEAATGAVLANIYPARAEAPYLAIGATSALVFLCLALIPVALGLANGSDGAALGLAICSGVGLVAGPVLFAAAAWIAAKI